MLLESVKALAASRHHDDHSDNNNSLPSSKRRHSFWSPEKVSAVTIVSDVNKSSDGESWLCILLYI